MPVTAPQIYNDFFAIVPNDFVSLAGQGNATEWQIYVGTGGDVSVTGRSGVAVVFKNAPAGSVLPAKAVYVNATGTTAKDLVALKAKTTV